MRTENPSARSRTVPPENVIPGDYIVAVLYVSRGVRHTHSGRVATIDEIGGVRRWKTKEGAIITTWRKDRKFPGSIYLHQAATVEPEPLFQL